MNNLSFSTDEKIKAFDRISECFLQRNFGSVGKSDIELLFFSIVMEHLRSNNLPSDDYSVSKMLGITQQRVRNLKVKNQLRNPNEFDWKVEFATKAQNARYSADDSSVIVNLDDPVLSIEVQYFIEQHNGIVDYTLNPKLLKMQTRDFASLLVEVGVSKSEERVFKSLRKLYQHEVGIDEQLTREKLTTRLFNGSLDFAKEIVSTVIVNMLTT